MIIREFRLGEELALHEIFHSSVHELARSHYTPDQISAWAPESFDGAAWVQRMRTIRPFVAEESGQLIAYADLQDSGYIDHFYVAGSHARRGIGSKLIQHILAMARRRAISELTSDVSLCAESLFARHGFTVVERRTVVVRSVEIPNVRMQRKAIPGAASTLGLPNAHP
jgi:putative acetyltransferase